MRPKFEQERDRKKLNTYSSPKILCIDKGTQVWRVRQVGQRRVAQRSSDERGREAAFERAGGKRLLRRTLRRRTFHTQFVPALLRRETPRGTCHHVACQRRRRCIDAKRELRRGRVHTHASKAPRVVAHRCVIVVVVQRNCV